MNQRPRDPIDDALAALPRELPPGRDLWAGISAGIERCESVSARRTTSSPYFRMAAGFLLVAVSSFATYLLTQQSAHQELLQARQAAAIQLQQARAELPQAPAQLPQAFAQVTAMPASFGGQLLGPKYAQAHTVLDAQFQQQIATLPPVARARLERNLADLRHAATQISATLAEHPGNPLLQELLTSTYQSELALLGSIGAMTVPTWQQAETRL